MHPFADLRRVAGRVAKPGPAHRNADADGTARFKSGGIAQPQPVGVVVYDTVSEMRALREHRSAEYRVMNHQGFLLANGFPAGERPLARGDGCRRSVTPFRHGGWFYMKSTFLSVL